MNKIKLAYAAGIIDGEGNIGIVKRRWSKRYDKYHLQVRVAMCDKEIPEWFLLHFGGSVSTSCRSKINPKNRDLYTWQISHRKCIPMLQSILPYLICKKSQAELAIQFQDTKHYGGGIRGQKGRPAKPDSELAIEEERYLLMRQLKNNSHSSNNR